MAKPRAEQKTISRPRQHQDQRPGREAEMRPRPRFQPAEYTGGGKLLGKVALITGGDSGIGRAVAVLYAREGADVAFVYLNEHKDAKETVRLVEQEKRRCFAMAGDVGDEKFCQRTVKEVMQRFGRLDILVNVAGEQHPQPDLESISSKQLERTFRTNIFSCFYMAKAALKALPQGGAIINTTSVTAYRGSPQLLDYSSTKGAIVAFTRSLSQALAQRGIRVNGVAPGPIWTPLITSTFPEDKVGKFGQDVPLGRPGEPAEVAPSYVFLASRDSSYMTGQILHPNGGEMVNG